MGSVILVCGLAVNLLDVTGMPTISRPSRPPRGARPPRSSGIARVSYDGKTVDYRSVAEIDRAIEALDREIAAAEGRRIVRQVRVTTAKGL